MSDTQLNGDLNDVHATCPYSTSTYFLTCSRFHLHTQLIAFSSSSLQLTPFALSSSQNIDRRVLFGRPVLPSAGILMVFTGRHAVT